MESGPVRRDRRVVSKVVAFLSAERNHEEEEAPRIVALFGTCASTREPNTVYERDGEGEAQREGERKRKRDSPGRKLTEPRRFSSMPLST